MTDASEIALPPSLTTEDFLPLLHQLPATVEAMAALGMRTAVRVSIPEQLNVTVLPNIPIQGYNHRIGKEDGRFNRFFDKQQGSTGKPFRIISFVIANPSDIPGENNNMIAFSEKRDRSGERRQRVNFLNLFRHDFKLEQSGELPDMSQPSVVKSGPFWDTEYPDCEYPDDFIGRGLDFPLQT